MEYMPNVDYSRLWESFGKLYKPISDSRVKVKIGRTNNRALGRIVRSVDSIDWCKIVELYFNTCISETTSFDDLFRQLNRYHDIQIDEFLSKVAVYNMRIRLQDDSYQFCRVKTENYIMTDNEKQMADGAEVHIVDYDYVMGIVYVEESNS